MKERPILFKPEMIQAILDGSKTMTRRAVKKLCKGYKGNDFFDYLPEGDRAGQKYYYRRTDAGWDSFKNLEDLVAKRCPYGQVGDRLWVKESFRVHPQDVDTNKHCPDFRVPVDYKLTPINSDGWDGLPWKSPLFMPRAYSRLLLEITSIRVERLKDISESDASEEGAGYLIGEHEYLDGNPDQYRECFKILWESINGKDSWRENPWVWVIEFKVVQP